MANFRAHSFRRFQKSKGRLIINLTYRWTSPRTRFCSCKRKRRKTMKTFNRRGNRRTMKFIKILLRKELLPQKRWAPKPSIN